MHSKANLFSIKWPKLLDTVSGDTVQGFSKIWQKEQLPLVFFSHLYCFYTFETQLLEQHIVDKIAGGVCRGRWEMTVWNNRSREDAEHLLIMNQ